MSQTTVNLGYVPKNRGEYSSTASYYKDNIVQYNGSSYICNPPNYDPDTAPTASITGVAPYDSDPAVPNTGWVVFCNDSSGVGEGVYDVSVDHTTDNQPKIYASLSAALNDIPAAKKKGGMEIRFIFNNSNYAIDKEEGITTQPAGTLITSSPTMVDGTYKASQLVAYFSTLPTATGAGNAVVYYKEVDGTYTTWTITLQSSDNKYVQYRLMANQWSTTVTDWQGVDEIPMVGSDNVPKSDGVAQKLNKGIIYTSTTDNFLDISSAKNDVAIIEEPTSGNYITSNTNGQLISDFIYVGDIRGGNVTISGYIEDRRKNLLLLREANYSNSNVINNSHLIGTSRTISIPNNAKYVILTLKVDKYDTNDYTGMKLSKTSSAATEEFKPYPLGFIGQEKYFNDGIQTYLNSIKDDCFHKFVKPLNVVFGSSTDNYLDISDPIKGLELQDITGTSKKKFVESDEYHVVSRLIPVSGVSKVTISGHVLEQDLYAVFLKNSIYEETTQTFNLNNTSPRTINVPSGYNFLVVVLRAGQNKSALYSNMKVSFTDNVATESFSPVFYGYCSYQYPNVDFDEFVTKNELFDKCPWYYSIYTSKTTNYLDVNTVLSGYRLVNNYNLQKTDNKVDVVSRPIYVGDIAGQQMTISGYTLSEGLYISFFKSADFVVPQGSNWYNLTNTSRTITVPNNAIFAIIQMSRQNYVHNYSNMKVSKSGTASIDSYAAQYLGDAMHPELFGKVAAIYKGEIDYTKLIEAKNTEKRFIPYSIGTPSTEVSVNNSYQRVNLIFFTDSHIDSANPAASLDNVADTIKFANESKVAFDAIINGGDAVTPYGVAVKSYGKNLIKPFFDECKKSTIPVLFTIGNHDTFDWSNYVQNAFDDDDWSEIWYNWAETNYGIVRQTRASTKKSTWNYYDIEDKKVRIICVNNLDVDKTLGNENNKVIYNGGDAFYISNEQFNWIANTALNFDDKEDKDWGVIIVSHQDPSYGVRVLNPNNYEEVSAWVSGTSYVVGNLAKHSGQTYRCNTANSDSAWDDSKWDALNPEKDLNKFSLMLKAFNEQSTFTESYTFNSQPSFNLSVNADWTRYANLAKKPYIICWLVGHVHQDKNEALNGIQMIWSLNGACTMAASDARVARVVDSSTQNAFDLISIDTKARKIRCIRYGAGKNCYGVGGDRFLPDGLSF